MRKLLTLFALGLLLPGLAGAGHGSQYDLLAAAKKLDKNARYLYKELHYQAPYSPVAQRARSLSRSAARFCDMVAYGERGPRFWESYRRLSYRFDRLSNAVNRRGVDPYLRKGFRRVVRSFDYLANTVDGRRYSARNSRYRYGPSRWSRGYQSGRNANSRGYFTWHR